MKFRALAILIACGFLLALIQLLGALAHPAVAWGCAAALGLVTLPLFRFFEVESQPRWGPVWLATAASLAGILIRLLNSKTASWLLALAPLAAFATAGLVVLVRSGASKRCGLCNRRLGSGVAFECPRCALLVCDQDCWDFHHCRCRLCEENKVPIFSPDGRWWDKQLGPRVTFGRCQLCQATAEAANLRACPKCGRPQCRPCWDYANGQCTRCGWVIADLPPQLKIYMAPLGAPRDAAARRPSGTRAVR